MTEVNTLKDIQKLIAALPPYITVHGEGGPTFTVCMLMTDPMIMPDNVSGTCNDCGRTVQMRPGTKALTHPIVCEECVLARIEGGNA